MNYLDSIAGLPAKPVALIVAATAVSSLFTGIYLLARARPWTGDNWREWCRTFTRSPWRSGDALLLLAFLAWMIMPALIAAPRATADLPPPSLPDLASNALFMQIAPLLIIGWRLRLYRARPGPAFNPGGRHHPWRAARTGLIYGLAMFTPVLLTALLVNILLASAGFTVTPQPVIEWLGNPGTTLANRAALVVLALAVAPVAEEILFRGVLLPAVASESGFLRSALLVSLLFGAIHLHGPSLIPLTLLGLGLCAGYIRTGHLLTPVVMHMTLNLLNLLAMLAAAGY